MRTRVSPATTTGRLAGGLFLLASLTWGNAVAQTAVPYAIRVETPAAAEMDIHELPPGEYLFEVEARDAATQRTSVRSRSFTLE